MNLKSTKRHIDVWLFSNELKNKTYSVFSVGLDFIFQTVKHRTQLKGYKETLTSIEKEGMRTPIILLENTLENYEKPLELVKKDLIVDWNPERKYLAYSGNSRIEIAKELSYDTIDVILVENMRWAHAAHLALQGRIHHETT
mgnify:FL=1